MQLESAFEYLCTEKDLDYWLQGNVPVILIVSRPQSQEAYWISIKDYFKDLNKRKTRKIYFNKQNDLFDMNCKDRLIALAISQNSGIYFPPSLKQEKLYSNLLNIKDLPRRIYIAETDYRNGKDLHSKIKDYQKNAGGEWLLKNKRIISFHNLDDYPWKNICDIGTIEDFDIEEWTDTDDIDKKNELLRLLNNSLREKVRHIGMRYDKDQDCYFFKAPKNLGPIKRNYKSLANMTERIVFQGYPAKGKKLENIKYFRHSAFRGKFLSFGKDWYLEITPTYYFTSDGKILYKFHKDAGFNL